MRQVQLTDVLELDAPHVVVGVEPLEQVAKTWHTRTIPLKPQAEFLRTSWMTPILADLMDRKVVNLDV